VCSVEGVFPQVVPSIRAGYETDLMIGSDDGEECLSTGRRTKKAGPYRSCVGSVEVRTEKEATEDSTAYDMLGYKEQRATRAVGAGAVCALCGHTRTVVATGIGQTALTKPLSSLLLVRSGSGGEDNAVQQSSSGGGGGICSTGAQRSCLC
jgi:hypothetical protein